MPPAWLIDLYNKFLDFRWIEASFGLYTRYVPWFMFYSMLYLFVMAVTYMKSRDMTVLGVASVITGVFFAGILPGEIQFMGGVTAFIGVVALFYRLFKKR